MFIYVHPAYTNQFGNEVAIAVSSITSYFAAPGGCAIQAALPFDLLRVSESYEDVKRMVEKAQKAATCPR